MMKKILGVLLICAIFFAQMSVMFFVRGESGESDDFLIWDCDRAYNDDSWVLHPGAGASSIDTDVHTTGTGSVKFVLNDDERFWFVLYDNALGGADTTYYDFSKYGNFSFDLWVDSTGLDFFNGEGDCGIFFSSNGDDTNENYRISAEALKGLTLTEGWNNIVLPLPIDFTGVTADITKIWKMYFYTNAGTDGETVRFDNFRLSGDADFLIWNCDNNLSKDYWSVHPGEGALSIDTGVHTTGSGSAKFVLDAAARFWFVFYDTKYAGTTSTTPYDFSKYGNFAFDLWVDSTGLDFFNGEGDCGIFFTSDGSDTNGNYRISAAALKGLTLTEGWNNIVLPLPTNLSDVTADITKIWKIYFYTDNAKSGETVRFDNFRLTGASKIPDFIDNCDTLDYWAADGNNGAISLDNEIKTEGENSIKMVMHTWSELMLFRKVSAYQSADFTGKNFFAFDLWVDADDLDLFKGATDCGINLTSDGSWDGGGYIIGAAALKAVNLKAGWNKVALPLPTNLTGVTADITKITAMRLYAVGNGKVGRVLRFDNFRFLESDGAFMSDCDTLDGWHPEGGYGVSLSLDSTIKTEGQSSLKVDTTGSLFFYRDVAVNRSADFRGENFFAFDMWVGADYLDIFSGVGDCGINLTSDGSWDGGGYVIGSSHLKALNLKAGWNSVVLPLPTDLTGVTADISKINKMRFYSTVPTPGAVVRFDNFRFVDDMPPVTSGPFLSDCESINGWSYDGGMAATLSLDGAEKTEGYNSLKMVMQGAGLGQMFLFRTVDANQAQNFTGKGYFAFDMWVSADNLDIFKAAGDCGINFTSDGSWDGGGYIIGAAALKAVDLKAGWNEVILPLPDTTGVTADITNITCMRIYSLKEMLGETVRFDNFRVGSYLTVTANAGGAVSESGLIEVADGGNKTITITPNAGYFIKSVKVNAVSVALDNTTATLNLANAITLTDITAGKDIAVEFSPILYLKTGASIRLVDTAALRFSTEVSQAFLADLTAKGITYNLGTLILPTSMAGADDLQITTTLVLNIEQTTGLWHNDYFDHADGYNVMTGVITNIKLANYQRELAGRAYITFSGQTIYTPQINKRSLAQVAYATVNDPTRQPLENYYSNESITKLQEYSNGYMPE